MEEIFEPKWAQEIKRFISIVPQFTIWGNIYDVYPKQTENSYVTFRIEQYLSELLINERFPAVLQYSPLQGFSLLKGDRNSLYDVPLLKLDEKLQFHCDISEAKDILEKIITSPNISVPVIISMASRLPILFPDDIDRFYISIFTLCQKAQQKMMSDGVSRYNSIFWLLDKDNDIPPWYIMDNPKVKNIPIPKPDSPTRKIIIESISKHISGFSDLEPEKQQEFISVFIDTTNGLHVDEIVSIVSLAIRENIPFQEIAEAVRRYKIGIIDNPWIKIDFKKIKDAQRILSERVIGQEKAINSTVDTLKRSIFDLSGSQYSRFSNRPKGVLFFAGPTGVGKTELAKAITKLIFGSDTSYIRFDMTEFREENSDQRLIGAPPGYIGYNVGGQLTNAIKQNPFSVILFDEIEKANSKIFDIFMQILDDGRLTSGNGETVYFTESLIIFTSNEGVFDENHQPLIDQTMPYEKIKNKMEEAIKTYFISELKRPEILNRIGENIIVFDFIRPEEATKIVDKMVALILEKLKETQSITLTIAPEMMQKLQMLACQDLSMGGRGIGNHLDKIFLNPLSRALFEEKVNSGDNFSHCNNYILSDIIGNDLDDWKIVLTKKYHNLPSKGLP